MSAVARLTKDISSSPHWLPGKDSEFASRQTIADDSVGKDATGTSRLSTEPGDNEQRENLSPGKPPLFNYFTLKCIFMYIRRSRRGEPKRNGFFAPTDLWHTECHTPFFERSLKRIKSEKTVLQRSPRRTGSKKLVFIPGSQ